MLEREDLYMSSRQFPSRLVLLILYQYWISNRADWTITCQIFISGSSPVPRIKCCRLVFLQTTDTFTFVHITFTLHVYALTFILACGANNAGVTATKAAELATVVQHCISTVVTAKPLDISKEPLGTVPAVFEYVMSGRVFGDQKHLKPKYLNRLVYVPKPNLTWAKHCQNITFKIELNGT